MQELQPSISDVQATHHYPSYAKQLEQLEDRLVKLSLKGLHATGRIHYLSSMLWKFGASRTGLDGHDFEVLVGKSNIAALNWLENRSQRR